MKDSLGFIRLAAAIPHLKVADCSYNVDRIACLIDSAVSRKVGIVSFPELCVTGYTCADLFLQDSLLRTAEEEVTRLLERTSGSDICFIVGAPVFWADKLYNAAIVCKGGKIFGIVPKTFLPNYSEFYEKRWFNPADDAIHEIVYAGQNVPMGKNIIFGEGNKTFAVELCEDLWNVVPPSSLHCIAGARIIFNLSASDELTGKYDYLRRLVEQQSARCIAAYVYSSAGWGESTTDLFFSGNAMICENGRDLSLSERFSFEEQLIVSDVDVNLLENDRRKISSFRDNISSRKNYVPVKICLAGTDVCEKIERYIDPYPFIPKGSDEDKKCREVFSIQVGGLLKRIFHTKAKSLVIGVSGGLDSTLALLVCVKACDKLNLSRKSVIGITMPGFGTTDRTLNNAYKLMEVLDVTILTIDIVDACKQHFHDISFDPSVHDTTYENIQARERTKILMDYANKSSGLVVGTGDLSELALGWATYNGDHMSMYAVNSGVPKTLVRYLIRWIASSSEQGPSSSVLTDILNTPVSPELLPPDKGEISQKTEDIVGPYELHDFFLYYMVRYGFSPFKIYRLACEAFEEKNYSRSLILHWLEIFFKRFFTQQFKRSCMPDGPKVGSINISPRGDWRMPSDAEYSAWMKEIEEIKNAKR